MKALIKIKQSPIMDRRHVEERDDKTNYRTQTEVCGFGARTPRSVNRIHSRVCRTETRKHSSSFTTNRNSSFAYLQSGQQLWPTSGHGRTSNACGGNSKSTQCLDLFIDKNKHCVDIRTSYNLGGAA